MVAYQFKAGVFLLINLEGPADDSWSQVAASMGFHAPAVCHFGGPDEGGEFTVYVYSRTGVDKDHHYRYLVDVSTGNDNVEHLFCSGMPDLLQLLPLLAPIARLNSSERGNLLETLVSGSASPKR